jgi:hypothetical protein
LLAANPDEMGVSASLKIIKINEDNPTAMFGLAP